MRGVIEEVGQGDAAYNQRHLIIRKSGEFKPFKEYDGGFWSGEFTFDHPCKKFQYGDPEFYFYNVKVREVKSESL